MDGSAAAQQLALLYEAGLDRDGNIDTPGLNFWIDAREGGQSLRGISQAFLDSREFTVAFGDIDALTDRALVEQLYRNVLDRAGEPGGVEFWTGRLADGVSRAVMLIAFARSPENVGTSAFVEDLAEVSPGVWDFVA